MVKDDVLKILMASPETLISGQSIAKNINVSRTAVWKAISTLQKEGFLIEQVPNRGYVFHNTSTKISKSGIVQHLTNNVPVHIYDSLPSTNSFVLSKIDKFRENGTTIIALEQTGGRGRFNRPFLSPANSGVYMSVVLENSLPTGSVTLVTAATAVAVSKAIYDVLGIQCDIKWVNDLFLGDKKVCGILTEGITSLESHTISHLVVGIGLNTSSKGIAGISDIAASVGENDFNVNLLIANIIDNLLELHEKLSSEDISFMDYYRSHSNVIGKIVFIRKLNRTDDAPLIPYEAINISDDGTLIVKSTDGKISKLSSGEVSLKFNR